MSMLAPWRWTDLLNWVTGLEDASFDYERMEIDDDIDGGKGVIGVDPSAQLVHDRDPETGEDFGRSNSSSVTFESEHEPVSEQNKESIFGFRDQGAGQLEDDNYDTLDTANVEMQRGRDLEDVNDETNVAIDGNEREEDGDDQLYAEDDESSELSDQDDDYAEMPLSPEEEESLGNSVLGHPRRAKVRRPSDIAKINAKWEAANAGAAKAQARQRKVSINDRVVYRSPKTSMKDGDGSSWASTWTNSRRLPAPLRSSLKSCSPKFGAAATIHPRIPRGLHLHRYSTASPSAVADEPSKINTPVNLNSPFVPSHYASTWSKSTSSKTGSPTSHLSSPKLPKDGSTNAATHASTPRSALSPQRLPSPWYPTASPQPWTPNLNLAQGGNAVSRMTSHLDFRSESSPYLAERKTWESSPLRSRTTSLKSSPQGSPYYFAKSHLSEGTQSRSRTASLQPTASTSPRYPPRYSPGLNTKGPSSPRSRTAFLNSVRHPSTPFGPTKSFEEVMSRRPPSPYPPRTSTSNRITQPKSNFKDFRVRKVDPLRYKNKLDRARRLPDTPTRSHLPPSPRRSVSRKRACETCSRAFRVTKRKKSGKAATTGRRQRKAAAVVATIAVEKNGRARRSGRARRKPVQYGA